MQRLRRKAADQDDPLAETNLGLIYAKGAGRRPDFVESPSGSKKPQNKVSLLDKQISA
jgi:hypothetical protein